MSVISWEAYCSVPHKTEQIFHRQDGTVETKFEHIQTKTRKATPRLKICASRSLDLLGFARTDLGYTSTPPVVLWQLSSSSLLSRSIIRASLCPINPANHCYGWWMHKHYTYLALASGYEPVSTSCRSYNLTEGEVAKHERNLCHVRAYGCLWISCVILQVDQKTYELAWNDSYWLLRLAVSGMNFSVPVSSLGSSKNLNPTGSSSGTGTDEHGL